MKKLIEKLKAFKYWKDVKYTAIALAFGVLGVLGEHWSEVAKTSFWWTFWDIAKFAGIGGFVGGFIYLVARDRSKG